MEERGDFMKFFSFKDGLYIFSWVTFISCIIAGIFLPRIISVAVPNQVMELTIFLYLTLIPFFPLLWSVIKMSQMLRDEEPFSELSLFHLKRVSVCAFLDVLLYVGGIIYFKQFVYCLMLVVTLLVSLIGLIILELIKNGIALKEENELTI